jgi:hypothetical protein
MKKKGRDLMKLYLNEKQRSYLLEVFKVSEKNAVNGKDAELANAFSELYEKIKPLNIAYVNLNRAEAETIVEFCDLVADSLVKAINFLNADKERSKDEINDLLEEAEGAKIQIESIADELRIKIRNNPV